MLNKFDFSNLSGVDRISGGIAELRQSLSSADPALLAANTASLWHPLDEAGGYFQLPLWRQPVQVSFPAWTATKGASGQPLSPVDLALLLYYFKTADGFPLSNRWISFADLPDGRFYNQAFQGYTGNALAQAFNHDLPAFERLAPGLGGEPAELGDASFIFQALPRVPLCVVFWQGDEDFPDSAQVLFDASASHYLTTDSFAILGSAITRRLIAAKNPK